MRTLDDSNQNCLNPAALAVVGPLPEPAKAGDLLRIL
jgi:hypothetical protein